MPQTAEERVANASRVIDVAVEKGVALSDIYVDPLYFPVSVDSRFGVHAFESIRQLRAKYGPDIHISGGMSNISFGIPARKMINDVFMIIAVEAGADSGIIDPVSSRPDEVFSLDRESTPYKLAEDVLMGRDDHCANYIGAWRQGELGDSVPPPRARKRKKKA
jgi:5-methyltetrahydrofolate--homocysteine methyltransferase